MTRERLYVGDFVSIDTIGEIIKIEKVSPSGAAEFTIKFNKGIAYMPENCLTPAPEPKDVGEQDPTIEQTNE